MNQIISRGTGEVLQAEVTGQGPALLLLHGFPFDHTMWRPQIRELASRARVIAPDLRGLGRSELGQPEQADLKAHARDMIEWLDQENVDRAVVAGLSFGGYIAFELFREAPDRMAALALIDTKADADSPEGRTAREATNRKMQEGGMAAVVEGMIQRVLGETTRAERLGVVEHVRRMILATSPAGACAANSAIRDRPSSRETCARVRIPTMVVVGEEDELTPVADSQVMAASIPNAELRVIPGAGHVTSLEAPADVTAALAALLDRAFPSRL